MTNTPKCPICGKMMLPGENSHMILITAEPPNYTACMDCESEAERLNEEFRESEAGIRSAIAHAEMGIRLTRERLHRYVEEVVVLYGKLERLEGEE